MVSMDKEEMNHSFSQKTERFLIIHFLNLTFYSMMGCRLPRQIQS